MGVKSKVCFGDKVLCRHSLVNSIIREFKHLINKLSRVALAPSCIALISVVAVGQIKAQEVCLPAQELHEARKAMQSIDFPGFGSSKKSSLKAISMYEKDDGSKDIFYAAVIDEERKKGWVLRYGGYNGNVAWYGPITLKTTTLAGCSPALSTLIQSKIKP
jgi:hypothetical protein